MTGTTRYPYSLNFSFAAILLLLIFMWMSFSNAGRAGGSVSWVIYAIPGVIFLVLLGLLIVTRLVPALKGNTALELDDEGISDYIRNISVNWIDIQDISLVPGRSSSMLRIDLKWESEYGSQVNIPLRWVKGKDAEI